MKTRYSCLMVAFAVLLMASPSADAGTQDGSVVTVHAKAHTTKATTICTTWMPTIPCSAYITEWALDSAADVYLVVGKAPDVVKGIAGMSCGILYDNAIGSGVDVFGWTLCADLEFTNGAASCPPDLPPCEWPISGGGNRITWVRTTNCQRTVIAPDGIHAIAGAFYLFAYSPDAFQITPNNNLQIPELAVADCDASTTYLVDGMGGRRAGWVGFGFRSGCNPCSEGGPECWPVPVERSTWGAIKRTY
jgi:hypothetical protein